MTGAIVNSPISMRIHFARYFKIFPTKCLPMSRFIYYEHQRCDEVLQSFFIWVIELIMYRFSEDAIQFTLDMAVKILRIK